MAMLKCKMCGGDIEITNESYGTCDSCGSTMTLPKIDDDKKANLFNRANHFRRQNDFDKALIAYENILNEDNSDAEAHWGCVLSRYGIEYVEDPKTHKRIPTCHRVQKQSILNDSDYILALENAPDSYTCSLYEAEGEQISQIQKSILAISNQTEPYDVFICYKESTDGGTRTKDSTIAQDIYYQLTNEKYKVFFARITLEDKLGKEYEPYIFAALNSAKVMLVIGTNPEYINAVWVKNEWSRYLKLMDIDNDKLIIPCYRDMDAYDLPEELSMYQSQDMSKIGFIQDLIRGIKKVLESNVDTTPTAEQSSTVAAPGVQSLYDRAVIFQEDGDFKQADEYFDRVLDIDPKYAPAYIGKLCCELECERESHLNNNSTPLDEYPNYKKGIRFADSSYNAILLKYNKIIVDRIEYERIEEEKKNEAERIRREEEEKEKKYREAKGTANRETAIYLLKSIIDYKDSRELIGVYEKEKNEDTYKKAKEAKDDYNFEEAIKLFKECIEYNDSQLLVEQCEEEAKIMEEKYVEANERRNQYRKAKTSCTAYLELREIYIYLKNYKYSKDFANECLTSAEEIKSVARAKKIGIIIGSSLAVIFIVFMLMQYVIIPNSKYNEAMKLYENNDYTGAIEVLKTLDNGEEVLNKFKYNHAIKLHENKDYAGAITVFGELGDYKDSKEKFTSMQKYFCYSISAGNGHTIGLKSDGTVVAVGDNQLGQSDVKDWADIIVISAGTSHTVGVKSNGTAVATIYTGSQHKGQCDVKDWADIVAVSAGSYNTVGLKSDGTVVAVGENDKGQCNVQDWADIVAISTAYNHTIGLKLDGTVIAIGDNEYGQCNVSDWTDIVAVSAGSYNTVGLKSDGTVIATGYNSLGQCDVSDWTDIVAVSAGSDHTVGLKSDGTVVATGDNSSKKCEVSDWKGIVAISTNERQTVGLKADGTVVAVGNNEYGQCDVSDWKLW